MPTASSTIWLRIIAAEALSTYWLNFRRRARFFGAGSVRLSAGAGVEATQAQRRAVCILLERVGPPVGGFVHRVPQAGYAFSAAQPLPKDVTGVLRLARLGQHGFRAEGGTAVQRTCRGAESGGHDGVRICAYGRGDPGRKRGGGQFVVGE